MRVIPVIDLLGGQVVRGIAGRRHEYQPIESPLAADARPATVARALRKQFGFDTVYVADLNAIQGRPPNVESWQAINGEGLGLWLDAGIGNPQALRTLHALLLSRSISAEIVIALESLQDDLSDEDWRDARGLSQLQMFSIDLKSGIPNHQIVEWRNSSAIEIGRSAHARGFRDIIVLDLADVGTSGGTRTIQLCQQLKRELHPVRTIAGGGVRGFADLQALAAAGCDAVLVASALHDGRLTPGDIQNAARLG